MSDRKEMRESEGKKPPFLSGLRNFFGVGIYLLLMGILLEALMVIAHQFVSLPISIPTEWQIALTLVCAFFCGSGIIWFNKTLNLAKIHIAGGENKLMTYGPFNYVRHPLYATLIFTLPPLMIIWFEDILFVIPWILIYLLAYQIIKFEEQGLIRVFGYEYEQYKEFVPGLIPYKGLAGKRFREYRARTEENNELRLS